MTITALATPKLRRRWLQFSLRMMMIVMLVFCCGSGWLAYQVNQARQQREAAKAIAKLGGTVDWDPASGGMIGTAMARAGKLLGQDLFVEVRRVYLDSTRLTDAELTHLTGTTKLDTLYVNNTLDLSSTRVTHTGLAHLRGLKKLEVLSLHNTLVSDAGVAGFKNSLPNVKIEQ